MVACLNILDQSIKYDYTSKLMGMTVTREKTLLKYFDISSLVVERS